MKQSFGKLKSHIEDSLIESYGKPNFKDQFRFFKKNILENKEICEIYNLYDQLSENKNLDESLVDEFIDVVSESLKVKLKENKDEISRLLNNIETPITNRYQDIDNIVYDIKSSELVERVISKKNIKTNLLKETVNEESKTPISIPFSSMSKISAKAYDKEFSNLNEDDMNKVKYYLSLDKNNLNQLFEEKKQKLVTVLNEKKIGSNDEDLNSKIDETLSVIKEYKSDLHKLYKIDSLLSTIV